MLTYELRILELLRESVIKSIMCSIIPPGIIDWNYWCTQLTTALILERHHSTVFTNNSIQ